MLPTYAQPYETNPDYKRANIWYFGYQAGVDFNSGSPAPVFDGQTKQTWEGFSTLCDTAGNLLFYTDTRTVWNKNHDIVENGTDINGHPSSTQGSVLLQHPENDSLVHLFVTVPSIFPNVGLRHNVINTKSNNGGGKVIVKNKLLLSATTEKLTAINHDNGKDIWIIAHGYTSNSYFSYLLTKEGLVECPVQSVTGNILEGDPTFWSFNCQGNMLLNYQGNQVAAAILRTGKVEIFDFDNSTGILKISDTIYFNSNVYCVAYNGKGNRLFIQTVDANRDTSYLYYYENKELVLITKYLHGTIQYLTNFNDVIYVGSMDSSFLSAIENINDSLPTFQEKAVDLNPFGNSIAGSIGLCNFNPSYHYTPSINFTYRLNCIENTIQFHGQDTFSATTHDWLITKQGAAPVTANIKAPLIEFEDTGVYSVRYIASNGSRSDTVTKEVTILPKIDKNFLGSDTGWCESVGASLTLQAPLGMHCYEWSNGNTGNELVTDTTGVYFVKIVTPNFCVLYDTITVTVDTVPNAPTIYRDNDTLKTDDVSPKYLWLRDGNPTGTNSPRLVLSDTGIYQLQVMSNGGCTAFSDTIHIPAEADTSTDNVNTILFKNIKLYPNPATNELTIEVLEQGGYSYEITGIAGNLITSGNLQRGGNTIDITRISAGVYFVHVLLDNNRISTCKLIKVNE
ncbi:MAG: T9SS type A sorting domain-containing protein [Bacteroidia bacterium]|nr:T9SS type A sorting domain-containing protein [Bacteroidia bacterium]